jgi:cysteine desulfurase
MKEVIYLDNNATTKIDPRVLNAMMPYLTDNFANANSTHQFGLAANEAVKVARQQIATLLGCETNEIIFTSGATEGINIALKGIAESYSHKGKHIITVNTEHTAVLDTCKYLEKKGFTVSYLPVNKDGLIDIELLKSTINPNTILISVMIVNNETGVIQNIKEISTIARNNDVLFMTDATQAVGKMDINIEELQIDVMPFSGHKIYGPKGVGALYVRQKRPRKVKMEALQHGGGHEKGLRSGTLNVPGIVGLGFACDIALKEMKKEADRISILRDEMEAELLKIDGSFVNGNKNHRLFNTLNICFPGIDSDALIMGLSNPESDKFPVIALSNGSACTASSIEPSHVLSAMGLTEELAFNSIRISLGRFSTKEDVATFLHSLTFVVKGLKAMIRK